MIARYRAKGIVEGYQIFQSTQYIMEGQHCQIQEIGKTLVKLRGRNML